MTRLNGLTKAVYDGAFACGVEGAKSLAKYSSSVWSQGKMNVEELVPGQEAPGVAEDSGAVPKPSRKGCHGCSKGNGISTPSAPGSEVSLHLTPTHLST